MFKRSKRRTQDELASMLSHVGGLGSAEAAERAAELAPMAAGDTLTLVTDWVFWSELPEDDRPAFENYQRHTVFDNWE